MPVPPAAVELLTDLSQVLTRWGRWYVFGAQAVVAYGFPRLSADVDVTIALAPDDPSGFARDLQSAGFSPRISDPGFVKRTRVMPFIHDRTGMPLDIVLAGSGLEESFITRAIVTDIGGAMVPIIHLEDLIVAKVLAGRPKDIGDAAGLWRLHRQGVSREQIVGTLRLLEEALGQSDLVAAFDGFAK